MGNNPMLGILLTLAGLLLFASAINRTTGATLAGLIYGKEVLKNRGKTESIFDNETVEQAWRDPASLGGKRAGVIPILPGGIIPGLTPITPKEKMG